MPSDVDICNLALSHLGDEATVASIDPPEGSAQAEHCARFYAMARDTLQEMHPWGFCTRRSSLALLTGEASGWLYCYAIPAGVINIMAVLDPLATDDYSVAPAATWAQQYPAYPLSNAGAYTPQKFATEALADGTEVIYTNQADAVLRYTARVTDPTKFSPLFADCLSWLLASHLAGPVLKGDTGTAAATKAYQVFQSRFSAAIESDSNQRRPQVVHNVGWLSAR